MRKRLLKKCLGVLSLAAALMAVGSKAEALVVFDLNYEFSGATEPMGDPPWLRATFQNQGTDTVRLTMEATGLVGTEGVGKWWFNLNPALNVSSLAATYLSGVAAGDFDKDADDLKADGGGYYDFLFDFNKALNAGETSVYDLTLPGLTESDFNFLAVPSGGNGVYHTAAHVQSIGPNSGSGFIGDTDNPPPPVPEPSTVLLLGAGLAGLATMSKRKKNR